MLNFEEELKKFTPCLDVENVEEPSGTRICQIFWICSGRTEWSMQERIGRRKRAEPRKARSKPHGIRRKQNPAAFPPVL